MARGAGHFVLERILVVEVKMFESVISKNLTSVRNLQSLLTVYIYVVSFGPFRFHCRRVRIVHTCLLHVWLAHNEQRGRSIYPTLFQKTR